MVIITDENDIVKQLALIPGNNCSLPEGWKLYFPVTQEIPGVGQKFEVDFESQPWLKQETI